MYVKKIPLKWIAVIAQAGRERKGHEYTRESVGVVEFGGKTVIAGSHPCANKWRTNWSKDPNPTRQKLDQLPLICLKKHLLPASSLDF